MINTQILDKETFVFNAQLEFVPIKFYLNLAFIQLLLVLIDDK